MARFLGQRVAAPDTYAPEVLEPIERLRPARAASFGWDVWHTYELSWCVGEAISESVGWFAVPADSPATVESKSLKLYLNSLNDHVFSSDEEAAETISRDVSACLGAVVSLRCLRVDQLEDMTEELSGVTLPACRRGREPATVSAEMLTHASGKGSVVSEHLVSHSLRSLCPVTAQPDWGSLSIRYTGDEIDRDSLSRYLSGYRNHQGFHEQCVEQIYCDLMILAPDSLQVAAFYQRRGGIDITPWRSSVPLAITPQRLGRQ